MKKTSTILCAAAALSALAGCPNDPVVGTDAGMTSTTDAFVPPGTDTGVTPGTDAYVAPLEGGTCAEPLEVDGTGRIVFDNTAAPEGPMAGLAIGSCTDDGEGGSTANHVVVVSYTMETSAFLVASTEDAATTAGDTVVWVLDACSASGGEIACNDDGSEGLTSRATSAAQVAAGTTVFIAVGSYGDTDPGAIALTVSEVQPHNPGEDCSDTGLCVANHSCLVDDADMATCVADGIDGGLCRVAAPFCDSGLGCTNPMPSADDRGECQMEIAVGGVCSADHFVCVAGATCLADLGSTTMGHCIADGADLGLCRTTGMACDSGLTCSEMMPTEDEPGICQVPVATGAVCTARNFLCASATASCQLDEGSETMGRCLEAGTEYGFCRTTGMACDAGFTCSVATPTEDAPGTCQVPIAGTELCTARHNLCVDGFSCQLDDLSETVRHCIADGGDRGECRATAPVCDGTFTCSTEMGDDEPGICLTPAPIGGVCTAWRYTCVDGSTCVPDEGSETMGHCLPDGAEGAACRDMAPECDGTLTCFFGTCYAF